MSCALWSWSRQVTIFLVKSKATCLLKGCERLALHERPACRVLPWALWATDCNSGELLLGKEKCRQLFAFLGMFNVCSLIWGNPMKLQRDWGILKYAEFRTMCKYPAGNRATPFSFPVKLPGPDPGKKSWEIILCITSATFRAAFRQRWVHLYWDEKRVKQRWKTGNLRHPFSHIWEQVCVHDIYRVFWYRLSFSLYLLMGLRNQGTCHWSHHLRVIISKTLIVPCRDWNHTGVKGPETAVDTTKAFWLFNEGIVSPGTTWALQPKTAQASPA